MIKDYIAKTIKKSLEEIDYLRGVEFQEIALERPRVASHGDLSTNIAMVLAPQVKMPSWEIAQDIVARLRFDPKLVTESQVAGPGFINFRLGRDWLYHSLLEIIELGGEYGRQNLGKSRRVQVEFVSANPTGPLNVVGARAAAVGDALANLLEAIGYQVEREYWVNDAGNQIRLLAESIDARYHQLLGIEVAFPEDGYHGEYIEDIAREIIIAHGRKYLDMPLDRRLEEFREIALKTIIENQRRVLEGFGVHFDVWFSEQELRETGALEEALDLLTEKGHVYEHDQALWFKSTLFGDEKDRVLVTKDGQSTYFLADIAYHRDKFQRGFNRIIDLWGPDHHGHITRMYAAMKALGYPNDFLEVKIVQQVNLFQEGRKVKMSKRTGKLVSMEELIDEVGADVARFFFLRRRMNSHLGFELDLAKEQSEENPVYYVQYAHARVCSLIRYARERGVPPPRASEADLSLLDSEEEVELIKRLASFPEKIERSGLSLGPHPLTTYLQEVAGSFHRFYHRHRVVTNQPELTAARLVLAEATKIVLNNALTILGISSPEKM